MRIPKHVIEAIDSGVERGAKRLDSRRPNWYREIDLRTLDLSHSCLCICGQLYGEYGVQAVGTVIGGWVRKLYRSYYSDFDRLAGRYGFVTPKEADEWMEEEEDMWSTARDRACWNRLERKWKEQIKARLNGEHLVSAGLDADELTAR